MHSSRFSPCPSLLAHRCLHLSGALLASVASLLTLGCSPETDSTSAVDVLAPPIEVVQARTGALPLVARLSGTVRAANQVVIYPEFSGRIAEVYVDDGDTVTAGDPLVRIHDDQVRERARQAEAGHRISAARLRQAQARLAEVDAQTRRAAELNARNLVPAVEYETLLAQRESAAADVELAEAELEQAAATLAERKDLLSQAIVRAPVSGVVGGRRAEIGLQVATDDALFTLGDLADLRVHVNLTDSMVGYIRVGQPAELIISELFPGRARLTGEVARISPFLDEVTRTTEAEILITQTEADLRPGMFVPVDIRYGQSQQATLVPTSALFTDPNTGQEGFYLLSEGSFDPIATAQRPDRLSAPVPVTFQTARIVARGAQEVALAQLPATAWVVTLGQDLLATDGRTRARARPVDWAHVMELQSLRREDLLLEVLAATGNAE